MIQSVDLHKSFGELVVLDGLDFEVERGERVAFLGANGAGKTTLFRCLLGLTDFEGELAVDGHAAGPAGEEVRRRVGYVPQLPPVYDLTLRGFVDLFTGLREVPREAAADRLADLGLSLEETGGKEMGELSGGMLQKAYLAMALAAGVPALLLDEPTASLDPASRREFVRLLQEVDGDATMLLASHRLEEIEPLADRLVVLHRGRIAFDGTLEELWATAGTTAGLWIATLPGERETLARELRRHPAVRAVHSNGTGIRVDADETDHLDVLERLRRSNVPVVEFRTRPPALEEVLARLVGEAGEGGLR